MDKAVDPAPMQAARDTGSLPQAAMDAYWMPFTANRQFKKAPRLLVGAEGMYYRDAAGRQVLDAVSGLWCVNAGHARPRIVKAIQAQAAEMDFAPSFQMAHPKAFELAQRLTALAPAGMNQVFFVNSGSEAVETALKIAIAYHRVRGEGARTRLIGRERGYHGVNFGGISVGGIVSNRKHFGTLLAGVDHIRHTHDPARNAFARGLPAHGAEFADDLERLVALHDASTIAAVIVEPVAGSTGVLIPPQGYLQRLREICDRHGILLVFDEVICGFGRTGKAFAAQSFGVRPDLLTVAKAITNGAIPMGAVAVDRGIHEAIIDAAPDLQIEFFHGYTSGGHPVAAAAAIATLEIYQRQELFARGEALSSYFIDQLFTLRELPVVTDIRAHGLIAGIDLAPDGAPGIRGYRMQKALFDRGLHIKTTGDAVIVAPALVAERHHIDEIVAILRRALAEER